MPDDEQDILTGFLPPVIAESVTPVAAFGVSRVAAGREQNLVQLVRGIVGRIRADAGCEQYMVHQLAEDSRAFLFYERWTTGKDLVAHVSQPYMQQYWSQVQALLDAEFQSQWVMPIDA